MATKDNTKYLYLIYSEESYGGEICEGQENDEWPSYEDRHLKFVPKYFVKEQPLCCSDWVKLNFPVNSGDTIYTVITRYTTGDTFGRTFGEHKIEHITKDKDKAHKIRDLIEDCDQQELYDTLFDTPRYRDSLTTKEYKKLEAELKRRTGEVEKYSPDFYPVFNGYFERLESVEVSELKVK